MDTTTTPKRDPKRFTALATLDGLIAAAHFVAREYPESTRVEYIDSPNGRGDCRLWLVAGDGSRWFVHYDRHGNPAGGAALPNGDGGW